MKIEDVTRLSPKGQVVIPKEIRKQLRLFPGQKMIVMTRDSEIVLKKTGEISLEEIAEKVGNVVEKNKINTDKLIDEAVKWARSKQH
jgi:AbrB family looped-hinge helix DNA binding protein